MIFLLVYKYLETDLNVKKNPLNLLKFEIQKLPLFQPDVKLQIH